MGSSITLSVSPDYVEEGARYRLSVATFGKPFHVMYDFDLETEFSWTPIDDGPYLLVLSIRSAGGSDVEQFHRLYWVRSPGPGVSLQPTNHPLVALYSAERQASHSRRVRRRCGWRRGPCQMRVIFQAQESNQSAATSTRPLRSWGGMNFLVAGMLGETKYRMRHEVLDRRGNHVDYGPIVEFETGAVQDDLPAISVSQPPTVEASGLEPLAWFTGGAPLWQAMATNLAGETLWYADPANAIFSAANVVDGGTILGFIRWRLAPDADIVELDLASNVVRQTNLERVNEQLVALGHNELLGFHHEVERLPNGDTAVLGYELRVLVDTQGDGPVDVLGDSIVVLDANFQVRWAWSSFDHLDPSRSAILDEKCIPVACPSSLPGPYETTNDWTHANALGYSPGDGNLIISLRHQDWVVKIDYSDGTGRGEVLWRLGAEGDFELDSADPLAWHSHSHDSSWISNSEFVIFDNGNTRCLAFGDCESRGQVYELDEDSLTARLSYSTPLGGYSFALGSAQMLRNGNLAFGLGLLMAPPGTIPPITSSMPETTPGGAIAQEMSVAALNYRMYRLSDLYTAPLSINSPSLLASPEPIP